MTRSIYRRGVMCWMVPRRLKFARTRHGDSDIERGERQQQVDFRLLWTK
ncbi:hypothetical protein HC928_23585 [bacterium]|nr:hypothetical protein [bacterium]